MVICIARGIPFAKQKNVKYEWNHFHFFAYNVYAYSSDNISVVNIRFVCLFSAKKKIRCLAVRKSNWTYLDAVWFLDSEHFTIFLCSCDGHHIWFFFESFNMKTNGKLLCALRFCSLSCGAIHLEQLSLFVLNYFDSWSLCCDFVLSLWFTQSIYFSHRRLWKLLFFLARICGLKFSVLHFSRFYLK